MSIEVVDNIGQLKRTPPITTINQILNGWSDAPEEPEYQYIIPGPTGPSGAIAGIGPAVTVEVNLGSIPVTRGTFTISDAAINVGSKVLVWQAPGPYTGKGTRADEAELQPVNIIAVQSLSGSCKVYWETTKIMVTPTSFKDTLITTARGVFRQHRVRGFVKFIYMICRTGSTSIFPTTQTGVIQNLDFGNADVIVFNNASDATIYSLKGGTAGQIVRIYNFGSAIVNLRHASSAPAGGRILFNFIAQIDIDTPIASNGNAVFFYNDSDNSWRMLYHEQGKPITPTFSAGDFTASGAMTWTVAAGDILTDSYYIRGKTVYYHFNYNATTVGGTLSTTLRRAIPTALILYPIAASIMICRVIDNGTYGAGVCFIQNATSYFEINKIDNSNYAASTDNTLVQGTLIWPLL